MPMASINGADIHYTLEGRANAPVLIFSNSLGTSLHLWEKQVAAFSNSFRLLRYDTRGHGRSSVTPGPYTIEMLARDVVGLLDRLEIRRVHYCGLSLGGMVGMWLASHSPERIDRLVLANTSPLMGPREGWDKRIEAVEKGGMAAIVGAVIERWFTPDFRERHAADVEPVRATLLSTPAEGYVACCAAVRDMDQRAHLPSIRSRTLVIGGSQDPATPPAMCRGIADAVPGAKYVELSAAHLSNIEAAEAFNSAASQFLLS